MARLAGGDRKALKDIYSATSAKLFGICFRILNDRGEAEDALQDVYLGLWERADRYDPARASPISWLATFARNRAIDRLRKRKPVRGALPADAALGVEDDTPLADNVIEQKQTEGQIHLCLGKLEERQQAAIRSAFFDGVTYKELAEARGVPLGTMKSWVRRGLAALAKCLGSDAQ
ncbi:sigma-70 family RNA polymerase sigma factor [Altererythrobacter aquiaggeris]|uniref:sigma-70 family RNA polymerase sigma factor n=1 Tax=Aestuarierythrobacter aquiaggeris TaxID=1898396 RepID=UPI003018513B